MFIQVHYAARLRRGFAQSRAGWFGETRALRRRRASTHIQPEHQGGDA